MSGDFTWPIDPARGVWLAVRFTTVRREVVSYAVVLTAEVGGPRETVRVYDSAHGFNEMHRHTASGGKQPGEVFHRGTLGEGMRAAIAECVAGYEAMTEAWQR